MLCHDGEKINLPTCSFNSLGNKFILKGSGGSSVGRAIALNSRGPQFESSHRQKFILNIYGHLYWKDKDKENGPFFKKKFILKLFCFNLKHWKFSDQYFENGQSFEFSKFSKSQVDWQSILGQMAPVISQPTSHIALVKDSFCFLASWKPMIPKAVNSSSWCFVFIPNYELLPGSMPLFVLSTFDRKHFLLLELGLFV